MSFTSQHLFTNSPPRLSFHFTTPFLKNPNLHPPTRPSYVHFPLLKPQKISCSFSTQHYHSPLKAFQSDPTIPTQNSDGVVHFNLDSVLSLVEIVCILCSAIVSVSYAVSCAVPSAKKGILGVIGDRVVFGCGLGVLMSGVAIGAWIRRRQWRRICRESVRGERGESVNLLERIEKLEEDLKSSTTIIRVLSRQLEKLGIRFRVTRRSLKDPISEAAALAQKNSEATQALAAQEEILEKELGEIQNVLMAMQEQQQKQLDLIFAIGKSGKLLESRGERRPVHKSIDKVNLAEGVEEMEPHQTQASSTSKGTSNDRP